MPRVALVGCGVLLLLRSACARRWGDLVLFALWRRHAKASLRDRRGGRLLLASPAPWLHDWQQRHLLPPTPQFRGRRGWRGWCDDPRQGIGRRAEDDVIAALLDGVVEICFSLGIDADVPILQGDAGDLVTPPVQVVLLREFRAGDEEVCLALLGRSNG
uniref:Secreted protein n=1 Tax=Pyricularia oryzae (strain 70-15 / ATCC MYA-4617 / FGSC 8958) TaxID=242507 RepID=Q2KHD7_PYRO7|nr:hypothetical protein MGCH7_ch7g48 [Pyricularia oryzae 70-15]